MGLLGALAVLRPRVLVVAGPRSPVLGARAAAAVRARGWVIEERPTEADAVLVCEPLGAAMLAASERAWAAVPVPRARRRLQEAGRIPEALDAIARVLADDALQRREAPAPPRPESGEAAEPGSTAPDGTAPDGTAPDGEQRPGEEPAAAERTSGDRDGVHPLRLGPLMPCWPPGLTVDATVQRGVVLLASAPAEPGEDAEGEQEDEELTALLRRAAAADRILRLAGLPVPAAAAVRAADAALAAGAEEAERRLAALAVRVRRSSLLRERLRPPVVRERLLAVLDGPDRAADAAPVPADALARALQGRPVSGARMAVSLTLGGATLAGAGSGEAVPRGSGTRGAASGDAGRGRA